jgi:hypothetical protein
MIDFEENAKRDAGVPDCPKRLWVMTALSDDESQESGEELSRGLRFHLSRCPSCRELAEGIFRVSHGLAQLSALEPTKILRETADQRTRQVLRSGGRLTGRVAIPDEDEPLKQSRLEGFWRMNRRYAAAAAILILAGLAGVSEITRRSSGPAQRAWESESPAAHPPMPLPDPSVGAGGSGEIAENLSGLTPNETPAVEVAAARPTAEVRQAVPCRFQSHVEAAQWDDPSCVPTAFPIRAPREVGLLRWFDNSPPARPTARPANPR